MLFRLLHLFSSSIGTSLTTTRKKHLKYLSNSYKKRSQEIFRVFFGHRNWGGIKIFHAAYHIGLARPLFLIGTALKLWVTSAPPFPQAGPPDDRRSLLTRGSGEGKAETSVEGEMTSEIESPGPAPHLLLSTGTALKTSSRFRTAQSPSQMRGPGLLPSSIAAAARALPVAGVASAHAPLARQWQSGRGGEWRRLRNEALLAKAKGEWAGWDPLGRARAGQWGRASRSPPPAPWQRHMLPRDWLRRRKERIGAKIELWEEVRTPSRAVALAVGGRCRCFVLSSLGPLNGAPLCFLVVGRGRLGLPQGLRGTSGPSLLALQGKPASAPRQIILV